MIFKKTETSELEKELKRCSKGNRKAQEHLYGIYYRYAMSIAMRYSNSLFEAEEITNDSFYKVFTKREIHRSEKTFKPWFRRIIINSAIDHYRSNEKNRNLILLSDIPETPSNDDIIDTMSADEIIKLLQSLPPMYRIVFNLYVIEGYNHDEIGEKLGITSSTSRSNLTRAKHKLRELIKDYSYYEKAR